MLYSGEQLQKPTRLPNVEPAWSYHILFDPVILVYHAISGCWVWRLSVAHMQQRVSGMPVYIRFSAGVYDQIIRPPSRYKSLTVDLLLTLALAPRLHPPCIWPLTHGRLGSRPIDLQLEGKGNDSDHEAESSELPWRLYQIISLWKLSGSPIPWHDQYSHNEAVLFYALMNSKPLLYGWKCENLNIPEG